MRLDILLEPPGPEADCVMNEWLKAAGLAVSADGQVEVAPAQCLEVLVTLRRLCYDLGLTVNVKFTGKED